MPNNPAKLTNQVLMKFLELGGKDPGGMNKIFISFISNY